MATVVSVSGSGPRPVGSKMAVTRSGKVAGSVSGGCVENAVIDAAVAVLDCGRARLLRFGISNERAWEVGLSCGGQIEVRIEPLCFYSEGLFQSLCEALRENKSVALVTRLEGSAGSDRLLAAKGEKLQGTLGSRQLDILARQAALRRLDMGHSGKMRLSAEADSPEIFVDVFRPQPQLVVVGAGHLAVPLIQMARILGFWTILIDPRSVYANRERFPEVDQLIVQHPAEALSRLEWNQETALVAISHDEKIDLPALALALRKKAGYVGALGSRKTHAKRVEKLREEGISDSFIASIHAPIGLHLGGRLPEEIALAVLAEIVAVRYGMG